MYRGKDKKKFENKNVYKNYPDISTTDFKTYIKLLQQN